MTDDKIGTLHMQPSGRWAVFVEGREPVEITSGEVFLVEDVDELSFMSGLSVTRMGFRHFDEPTPTGPARRILQCGWHPVARRPAHGGRAPVP